MTGTPIRQDYLETVIKWINEGDFEGYMAPRPQARTGFHSPACGVWRMPALGLAAPYIPSRASSLEEQKAGPAEESRSPKAPRLARASASVSYAGLGRILRAEPVLPLYSFQSAGARPAKEPSPSK
jgi:hypothetical protein